jgi:hypothetical protein
LQPHGQDPLSASASLKSGWIPCSVGKNHFHNLQQDLYMSSIRTWHTYLGALIAPSVLFFALTGALQIFSLHEAHGTYQPLALVEKLASVHKDQVFAQKKHHEAEPEPAAKDHPPGPADDDEDEASLGTVLLKWFFLVVALGLAVSTALGLWMALTQVRRKRTVWLLLAAGVVIPVVLASV